MKVLTGLSFALIATFSASAATYTIAGDCYTTAATNSFGFSNPAPNSATAYTMTCASAASLGISGANTILSESLNYYSDYSNGYSGGVTTTATWGFSGAGLQYMTDTTTSTGGASSSPALSNNPLTLTSFNPSVSVVNQTSNGAGIELQGFLDPVLTGIGNAVTVNVTSQATVSEALAATGYAQVIYSYSTPSSTPEPVSMLLFGTGLLAVSVIGRKKFVRK